MIQDVISPNYDWLSDEAQNALQKLSQLITNKKPQNFSGLRKLINELTPNYPSSVIKEVSKAMKDVQHVQ